jgi:hypothetical protein
METSHQSALKISLSIPFKDLINVDFEYLHGLIDQLQACLNNETKFESEQEESSANGYPIRYGC